MKTSALLTTVAAACIACGPNNEENCENYCELSYECIEEFAAEDVAPCESACLRDVEGSDECADALNNFMECTGSSCPDSDCLSELGHLDSDC